MNDTSESGRIWFEEGVIRYESRNYGSWAFPLADLKVIGEYTTDNGPFVDDWFLVFVTSSTASWYEASNYAEGLDEFKIELASSLDVESLCGELAASTDFASRIIWPKSARGQQLFRFTPVPLPWWRRNLLFGSRIRRDLSSETEAIAGRA